MSACSYLPLAPFTCAILTMSPSNAAVASGSVCPNTSTRTPMILRAAVWSAGPFRFAGSNSAGSLSDAGPISLRRRPCITIAWVASGWSTLKRRFPNFFSAMVLVPCFSVG
ncbi:hypothetical protein D3218_19085 [Aureimonas flava]|uniref:Secreted protein n=1 Tax=Aureimonas flava TaxID=2320271 RepID=A0A3A1WF76_9HYPH|nr:hypothetical protein D3218_19085 [Aureimonas flava]